MATFSENQVRQLYTATALKGTTATYEPIVAGDAKGILQILPDPKTPTGNMYLQYKNKDNSIVRSDLINIDSILSIQHTKLSDPAFQEKLRTATITLAGDLMEDEDYILRIVVKNFIGMSDADQIVKYGQVRATKGMQAAAFYKAMIKSIQANLMNDVTPLFTVESVSDIESSTGIKIKEVAQPWTLGKLSRERVDFEIQLAPVGKADDIKWATIKYANDGDALKNGPKIADLEYFCRGERGDIYRGVGFPNNFPYGSEIVVADPTKDYDVIDIVYYYEGANEDVQKSQKVLSIAAESAVATQIATKLAAVTLLEVAVTPNPGA